MWQQRTILNTLAPTDIPILPLNIENLYEKDLKTRRTADPQLRTKRKSHTEWVGGSCHDSHPWHDDQEANRVLQTHSSSLRSEGFELHIRHPALICSRKKISHTVWF